MAPRVGPLPHSMHGPSLFDITNTMAAGALATQGTKVSRAAALSQFSATQVFKDEDNLRKM